MSPRFDPRRGNAPAEFVLVSALLVALVLALLHISLVIHVRHVLQASAWEGARWASYYGNTPSEGAELARELIAQSLSPNYAQGVKAVSADVAGQPGVLVTVTAPVPTLGLWSLGGELRVQAAIPREDPD